VLRRTLTLAVVVARMLATSDAPAREGTVVPITVTGARVHAGDLIGALPADAALLDVGPAPAAAGSRFLSREELLMVLREQGVAYAGPLPDGFRIKRKLRVLTTAELTRVVAGALEGHLPKGTTFTGITPTAAVSVPEGWTSVTASVPRPPHRTGRLTTGSTVRFLEGADCIWSLGVEVQLSMSAEAVPFDVPRGSHVAFVIRRGLVEVRASGVVSTDADVGELTSVVVTTSGKALPARIEDPTTAVMVETP
jgi:hypothetical protein